MAKLQPQQIGKRLAGSLASVAHRLAGDRSDNCGILVYHRICELRKCGGVPTMNVTPKVFRRQIQSLQEAGYQFVPLNCFVAALESNTLSGKTLAITFDDIFQNVYHNAFPVLKELRVPATIFLATAFLDACEPFPFDKWGKTNSGYGFPESYLPASTDQCREMQETGLVEIGAHTHTHRFFGSDLEGFSDDMTRCMECLRSSFQLERIPFAFPFGRRSMGTVSDEMIDIVRSQGNYCALTTDCQVLSSLSSVYGLGRFNVYQWDNSRTISAKVGGWYDWAPRLQDKWLARKKRIK